VNHEVRSLRLRIEALDRLADAMQARIERLERVNAEALRALDVAEEANVLLRDLARLHGAPPSNEITDAIHAIEARLEMLQQQ
jgi:prefoldin subunit 5